jgi:hypothetical protein
MCACVSVYLSVSACACSIVPHAITVEETSNRCSTCKCQPLSSMSCSVQVVVVDEADECLHNHKEALTECLNAACSQEDKPSFGFVGATIDSAFQKEVVDAGWLQYPAQVRGAGSSLVPPAIQHRCPAFNSSCSGWCKHAEGECTAWQGYKELSTATASPDCCRAEDLISLPIVCSGVQVCSGTTGHGSRFSSCEDSAQHSNQHAA